MSDKKIKVKIETSGGEELIDILDKSEEAAVSLKKQFREAEKALMDMVNTPGIDPKKIEEQAQKVGELKDKMDEAREAADAFSRSSFENVGQSLRGVKDGLLSLDFDKASVMAKNLMTNIGKISFTEVIQSAKALGSTMLTLGKQLLTNPYFLLAAIVVAIVVAIYKFLDSLGLIKVMMDLIGKAVEFVTGLFRKFLDIFTNGAASAAHEAELLAKKLKDVAEQRELDSNDELQRIDQEIRMRKLAGENTDELEKKRQMIVISKAKADKEAADAELKRVQLNKDATNEEIKSAQKAQREKQLSYQKTLDDYTYLVTTQTKKTQEEADKQKKIDEQNQKDRIESWKRYTQNRINASRTIEDVSIALMEDGLQKDLLINKDHYQRLREDVKRDTTKTAKERKALIALYTEQENITRLNIQDKYKNIEIQKQITSEKKLQDEKDKLTDIENNTKRDGLQKDLDILNEAKDRALDIKQQEIDAIENMELDSKLRSGEITKEYYDNQMNLLNIYRQQYQATSDYYEQQKLLKLEADKKAQDDKINEETALLKEQKLLNLEEELLQLEQQKYREENILNQARERGLIQEDEYNRLLLESRSRYEAAVLQTTMNKINTEAQLFGNVAKQVGSAMGEIATTFIKDAKKAFKINKGIQIAMATIDTILGGIAAFTGMVQSVPGPVGIILGAVAAAAVAAAGAASIAKISKTEFSESGTGSGDSSSPAASVKVPTSSSTSTGSTPTPRSLSGQVYSGGSYGQGEQQEGRNQKPTEIRAYVVESDISNTQTNISRIKSKSEIG